MILSTIRHSLDEPLSGAPDGTCLTSGRPTGRLSLSIKGGSLEHTARSLKFFSADRRAWKGSAGASGIRSLQGPGSLLPDSASA